MSAVCGARQQDASAQLVRVMSQEHGWVLDVPGGTALHEIGLPVTFVALPASEEVTAACRGMEKISVCLTPDCEPVWCLLAAPGDVEQCFLELQRRDGRDAGKMLRHVVRATRDAWVAQFNRGPSAHPN